MEERGEGLQAQLVEGDVDLRSLGEHKPPLLRAGDKFLLTLTLILGPNSKYTKHILKEVNSCFICRILVIKPTARTDVVC